MKDASHFPPDAIAEVTSLHLYSLRPIDKQIVVLQIISEGIFEPNGMHNDECPSVGSHFSSRRSEVTEDDFNRVFLTVRKACDENKLNRLQGFDFINLYEGRIHILNRRIESLNHKLREMTKEITDEKHASLRMEKSWMRSMNLAKSLQRSNEV